MEGKNESKHTPEVEKIVCKLCHGNGQIVYGSTSTWRGGIGGAAMTSGVCNRCWGTGFESHKGPNLKRGESTTYHVEQIASLQAEVDRLTKEKKEMIDALTGVTKYFKWAIEDPNFHEYKVAMDLLTRIK